MKHFSFLALFIIVVVALNPVLGAENTRAAKGKLFIIGGGERTDELINRLIIEAKLREKGYIIILPMASEEPDSAIIWSAGQFTRNGVTRIVGFNLPAGKPVPQSKIDSLENAALIYISGGDQLRFMKTITGTPIFTAIHKAYQNGSVIAGTSAGAAVMSSKMITGNERRYPEYHETFRHIESENIEFDNGLGLLKDAVIDQHFVFRSRQNRLLTAIIENPDLPGIGIDESTAILVEGNKAEVVGESQVLVFRNKKNSRNISGIKLGARNLKIDIYLPGEKFRIKN